MMKNFTLSLLALLVCSGFLFAQPGSGGPQPGDNEENPEDSTAFVNEYSISHDFKLYPNPGSSFVYIQNESTDEIERITLLNLLGQPVFTQEVNASKAEFPVNNLPNGIYTVQVYIKNRAVILRKIEVLK